MRRVFCWIGIHGRKRVIRDGYLVLTWQEVRGVKPNPMTDRLRELARELEEFKTGTQPRNKSARERLEVETIHKTLNVVLSKIDALVRASAEGTDGASEPAPSCHCPATAGEDCPLTEDECDNRLWDYAGLPWFGARLRNVYEGFVRESANGVVCSIPDTGLNTPPHRMWCVNCQRRYMELKALVEHIERVVSARPKLTHGSTPVAPPAEGTEGATGLPVEQVQPSGTESGGVDRTDALDPAFTESVSGGG